MSYGALIPAKREPLADTPRLGRSIYYAVYEAIGLLLLLLLGLFIREGNCASLTNVSALPMMATFTNNRS